MRLSEAYGAFRACLLFVVLASVSTTSLAASQPQPLYDPAAGAAAVCYLDVQGYGRNSSGSPITGVKTASMRCTGGPVTMAINDTVLGPFADDFKGMNLSDSCATPGCLLTVCGSSRAVLANSSIVDVAPVGMENRWQFLDLHIMLCVKGKASVLIQNSSISYNDASAIVAAGRSNVTVLDSRMFGNSGYSLAAGVSAVNRAHVWLVNSIIHNSVRYAWFRGVHIDLWEALTGLQNPMVYRRAGAAGGGVAVLSNGTMTLVNSSILNTTCPAGECYGAGAAVQGDGELVVSEGSVIAGNGGGNADGGGVHVSGNATVVITNHSSVVNNTSWRAGGIHALGSGRVVVANFSTIAFTARGIMGPAIDASESATVVLVGPVTFVDHNGSGLAYLTASDNAKVNTTGAVAFNDRATAEAAPAALGGRRAVAVSAHGNTRLNIGEGALHNGKRFTRCSSAVFLGSLPQEPCGVGEYPVNPPPLPGMLFNAVCGCCPAQTFSWEVGAKVCLKCPLHAVCNGGDQMWPMDGFWRSSNRSTQMHKCPLFTKSCGEQGVCLEGYTGTLCGACAERYGQTLPLKCGKCMPFVRQLLLYLVTFIACVVLISFTVHFTWKDNRAGDTALRTSDLIKVAVLHLQYLVIFGSISVPWPDFLNNFFTAAAVVFSSASGQSSLDCLLKHAQGVRLGLIPPAILRLLVSLVVAPCAVMLAVVLVVVLSHTVMEALSAFTGRKRGSRQRDSSSMLLSKLRVTVLVVGFFAFPTVVKAALSFFACLPVDNVASKEPYPQYAVANHTAGYWVSDIQQACFAGPHRLWALGVGMPATILLCVGVPVALLLFLWRNKARCSEPSFQEHYGFLTRNYRDSKLWYEAVWFLQTVLMTAVSVFHYSLKAYYSLLLLGLVLALSAAVQLVMRPYVHNSLHRTHLASSCCLFVSVWLALSLFTFDWDPSPLAGVHKAAGAAMVAINCAFIGWCAYSIVQLAHPTVCKAVTATASWVKARAGSTKGLPVSAKSGKQRDVSADVQ